MKIVKFLSVIFALLLVCSMAQAQSTPEAIIGQCPSLPTPQQWAAGNTEAFQSKIDELQGMLHQQMANLMPTVTQQDLAESAAYQRRQQEQQNQQMQQMGDVQNAYEQGMADLQRQMEALASLGITAADLKKIEKMNDKQSEAYIKKRLAENGYTEEDLKRRMMEAGVQMMSDEEWQEEERRNRQSQAEGEAMVKAQETLEAYMEQSQVANKLIGEAEQIVKQKVEVLTNKYSPMIMKAQSEANQWEEVMRGTKTAEELESLGRKAEALNLEYREQVYYAWAEYILAAQGHLKILLSYAAAADNARRNMPSMTGNAATDQMQRMSDYAITVASQYLNITASGPEINM
ncbi:MAG: hypothetical protein FWH23_03770 [Bacteroidales bacterium]|nr:hypothetical protein [Bacteroidales bacterium]